MSGRPQKRSTYADADWSAPSEPNGGFWQSSFAGKLPGIKHIFTPLGYNMSTTSGSDTSDTPSRREAACDKVGSSIDRLTCAKQAHGTNIAVVRASDSRRVLLNVDGFVTTDPGVAIMALTADCPAIMVFDPKQRVLGLAHSGWKGTCANVVSRLLSVMTRDFNARAFDAIAAVAPCASGCCYEIKQDVADEVRANAIDTEAILREENAEGGGSRLYLDLPIMIAQQLESAGLSQRRIALANQCTICDERFYSYRRQGPNAGQAALMVCMTK